MADTTDEAMARLVKEMEKHLDRPPTAEELHAFMFDNMEKRVRHFIIEMRANEIIGEDKE